MKVVPYPKLFLSIFYLEFLEHGKPPFGSVKVWADLNPFEINLIRFENRIGRTVLPTPPVSAAPTGSPCRTQPLTIGPPSRPGPPISHVARVAPTPSSYAVARQRAAHARRGRAAVAPTTRRRTAPRRAQGPLSLPLSSALPSRGIHPSEPPSPLLPVKTEPPPAGRRVLTPRAICLAHPCPSVTPSFPSPRRPHRRFSATGAPPPCRTLSERRRCLSPLR
jgi:hypothetical protein